jgi:hypothetical protein
MYNALNMVKMYACKNATSSSINPMNTAKGTAIADANTDLKMKIRQIKLSIKNVARCNIRKQSDHQ